MSKRSVQVIKNIGKLDLQILEGLYEYRAMSTEQIQRRYDVNKNYIGRKLTLLRNTKLIISTPIRGYKQGGTFQGKYYRITEKGIGVLKEYGMQIDRKAFQLNVDSLFIPYLLTTNDLMIDLERYGWVLSDSREIKRRHSLNRSDNIQGTIQNVSTGSEEYGIYVFLENTIEKNIEKAVREIQNYEDITHYILFVKGQAVYSRLVDSLIKADGGRVVSGKTSIKILPYTFGKYYLRSFEEEDNLLEYAINEESNNLSFNRKLGEHEVNSHYSNLNVIVNHNGEEKYFVNLVDTDLKKINNIKQYRKEDYETDRRKILVYTNMLEDHKKQLETIHHIDYLAVTSNSLIEHLKTQ